MRVSGKKQEARSKSQESKGTGEQAGRKVIRNPLLVIVGPTAVGKTALSLHLAERLKGEIISADSRLFYRGMDVGTAKPTPEERARVPHHLIDIADPDETVGLAEYQAQAFAVIEAIQARGKLPLLVGGTGQYVRAVVEGWRIPRMPPDLDLRAELEAQAEHDGAETLHAYLARLDPKAAQRIHPHNVRRIVRALEVCLSTGRPISEQQKKEPPPYRILQIGLTTDRAVLYDRADRRLEAMMEAGLEEEVRRLLKAGYGWELPAMSGVGYAQFKPYFEGQATLERVVPEIKRGTRRFIRRQYNWFSLNDPNIRWFDVIKTTPDEVETMVKEWLTEAQTDNSFASIAA
jgi:tRNA dimethylallyltransferase